MKPFVRKLRVANPSRRRRKVRRHKSNPLAGGGVLTMLSNPHKKRHHRRSRRSRRRNPHRSRRSHRMFFAPRHHRRRRNPSVALGGFNIKSLVELGAGAAVGALVTRGVTQMALGTKNTGAIGYLGNAVAAVLSGWLTGKFTHNKTLGYAVAGGGFAALFTRIWEEKIAQTSISLHGLGDIEYSPAGLAGLSDYVKTGFNLPSVSAPSGGNYVVKNAALVNAPAPAATSTGAVPVSRFASRFASA